MRSLRSFSPLALAALAVASCGAAVHDVSLDSDGATLVVHVHPLGFELRPKGAVAAVARTLDPMIEIGTTPVTSRSFYPDPLVPSSNSVTYSKVGAVTALAKDGGGYRLTLATADAARTVTLTVHPEGDGSFSFGATPLPADPSVVHVRLHLAAADGEHFYGLGEYFDTFDQRGQLRDVHFQLDPSLEAGDNEAHIPVPAYVSTAGYGLLLDNHEPLVADMASTDAGVHLTLVAGSLQGHLFAVPTPVDAVARLQRLVGLPPLWPPWLFAPMQWHHGAGTTCSVPCAQGCKPSQTGSDVVHADAAAMRAHKLPGSLIWLDAPWQRYFNDFTLNPVQWPDGQKLIKDLNALGYQMAVWAAPFINNADDTGTECGIVAHAPGDLYDRASQMGYFVKQGNGDPAIFPWRGSHGSQIDLTNPDAYAFWKQLVHRITDLGVVGFKLDWDEYIVANLGSTRPDFRFHDGSTPATQHSLQHELFHRAHQEAIVESSGSPGFILARSGDASDARYAGAVWPGDLDTSFATFRQPGASPSTAWVGGLPSAVNAAVSLAASAHPHFGSDIGGYRGPPPGKELMGRWIEFGALSTVMQLGGAGPHNVWEFTLPGFDQELLDLYKKYARLHMSLFPYLYSYVKRNSLDGTPIVRAPALMYPGDAALAAAPWEYFFGEDLLVAPVVVDKARVRDVVLPTGKWVNFWTGEVSTGPATVHADAAFDVLPLYVRSGAVLPLLADDVDTLAPATDPSVVTMDMRAGEMGVRLYPDGDHRFTVYDGTELHATLAGGSVSLAIASAPRARAYTVEILWSLASAGAPASITRQSGAPLVPVTTAAAFQTADEGSYYDPAGKILHVKLRALADTLTVH